MKPFFIIFILFSIILSTSVLMTEKLFFSDKIEEIALENAIEKTNEKERLLKSFLKESEAKLLSLRESLFFKRFLLNPDETNQKEINELFLTLSKISSNIMQLRFIDSNGSEVIRVDRKNRKETPFTIPKDQLQDKSKRYYFVNSRSKSLEKVWFSAIDLNSEHGKIEMPHKPTLRAVLPVQKEGKFAGILIVNYFMQTLIEELAFTSLYSMILFDDDGRSLYHYEHAKKNYDKCWSNSLQNNYHLRDDFPDDYTDMLRTPLLKTDRFVSRKLNLPIYNGINIVLQLKKSYLLKQQKSLEKQFFVVPLLILFLSLIFTYFVVKKFSRTLLNIDKLEELNKNLRTFQLRNNLALKASEIGIWEWSFDTGMIHADDQMYKIFDLDKEEKSHYQTWSQFIAFKDKKRLKKSFDEAITHKKEIDLAFWINTSSDEKRYIKVFAVCKNDEKGDVCNIIGTIQNITEIYLKEQQINEVLKKNIEQQKAHQEEQLKNEKFSTLGKLTAGITHEINTPLTFVKGNLELLKMDLEDINDENLKNSLLHSMESMSEGVKRISLIVNNMRKMSQHTKEEKVNANIIKTLQISLSMLYNRSKNISKIYVSGK